jgi:hypothetical protein
VAKQGVRLKKKNEIAQLQSAETNVKGRKIRRNKKNGSSRTSGSSSSSSNSKKSIVILEKRTYAPEKVPVSTRTTYTSSVLLRWYQF